MFSRAEVQPSRARLVVDCKDAPDSAADLRDPECLSAVLAHLDREFGIDTVILSHYVEKQYGPRAMEVLRMLLGLGRLLSQMASRPPSPEFPQLSRKRVAAKCAACPFNPGTLFVRLRKDLFREFPAFHREFSGLVGNLSRYREPGCAACVGATTNDLAFLLRETARFAGTVLKSAPVPEGTG